MRGTTRGRVAKEANVPGAFSASQNPPPIRSVLGLNGKIRPRGLDLEDRARRADRLMHLASCNMPVFFSDGDRGGHHARSPPDAVSVYRVALRLTMLSVR